MPRSFDGVNDDFVTGIGVMSAMTYGTVAALFKHTASGGPDQSLVCWHNSVDDWVGSTGLDGIDRVYWHSGAAYSTGATLTGGTWYLQVVRKATGTAAPRFSGYNYTTKAWAHANGATVVNWTAPGGSGTIKMSFEGVSDFFKGDLAVRAIWSNALPWAADSGGDALLEAAGLQFSLTAWLNTAPSALWVFDQADVAQKVPDMTGGGANQSSVTGTAVSTNSVPSFGYSADLFDTRTVPSTGLPPPIEGGENSSTMYSGMGVQP